MNLTYSDLLSFSSFVGDRSVDEFTYSGPPRSELCLRLGPGRASPADSELAASVNFKGVAAYALDHCGVPSILFDIAVVDEAAAVAANPRWVDEAMGYGWPIEIREAETFIQALQRTGVGIIEIQSTCGMGGFVFASEVQIHDADGNRLAGWSTPSPAVAMPTPGAE